jgi:hypothetical protein
MPNMIFYVAEYLKVNLQTKRFERQVHFNVSLKEMHPSAALGDRQSNKCGGEKRGPRSGPRFSPPVKQIQRSPSEAESLSSSMGGVIDMFYRTTVILQ